MRRVKLYSALTSVFVGMCFMSSSAFAYYQDRFNPNSPTYNSKNGNYSRGGGNPYRVKTFATYEQYAYAVRHAMSRSYSFPDIRVATGNRVFIYDPQQLSWAAYDSDGRLVRTGPGSAGSGYCSDLGRSCRTPVGTFHVFSKQGSEYKSKVFPLPRGGAPMPYAMFFHGGAAIHGSYDVMEHNASHGCIRTLVEDAEWLNHDFLNYGSTVIIKPYSS